MPHAPADLLSVNRRLPFQTPNTNHNNNQYYISGSDRIGFGTSNPNKLLDVHGDARLGDGNSVLNTRSLVSIFTNSGTFFVSQRTKYKRIILVGGGGGGDGQKFDSTSAGGGGGGGEVILLQDVYLDSGNYSVVIGEGGRSGGGYTSSGGGNNTYEPDDGTPTIVDGPSLDSVTAEAGNNGNDDKGGAAKGLGGAGGTPADGGEGSSGPSFVLLDGTQIAVSGGGGGGGLGNDVKPGFDGGVGGGGGGGTGGKSSQGASLDPANYDLCKGGKGKSAYYNGRSGEDGECARGSSGGFDNRDVIAPGEGGDGALGGGAGGQGSPGDFGLLGGQPFKFGGDGVAIFEVDITELNINATVNIKGDLDVDGIILKKAGTFKIDHPLPNLKMGYWLSHSFVESCDADVLYSGMNSICNSEPCVIDIDHHARMTEGTFEHLCDNVRWFTIAVNGYSGKLKSAVDGNKLTVTTMNKKKKSGEVLFYWQVTGTRKDEYMLKSNLKDEQGRFLTEMKK